MGEIAPAHRIPTGAKPDRAKGLGRFGSLVCIIDVSHRYPARKTRVWVIGPRRGGGSELGYVRWHAKWRGYVFCPTGNTIYEEICLREIAKFVEASTKEHWDGVRLAKENSLPV